jgi:hypothetical protein
MFRATSHTRRKARDHCNRRALIGREGGDRPGSLHTRRWRSKGPKKASWMKSLHEVIHGGLWIRFQIPPSNSLKLIEFETYSITPTLLTFFSPTKYIMIPQHGPFSLHTTHEGLWLHKTAFPTPMVRPLDESQGSSPLQGHDSCLMCEKWPLVSRVCTPKNHDIT